jgi:regulatory protein
VVLRRAAPPGNAADARALALKLLARREHTQQELRAKLVRKGCAAGLAAEVVGQLARARLLSEERFIESYVQARRGRGYGPLRIREELRGKGVEEDAIAQWIDVGGREWLEELRRVRRKKFGAGLPKSFSERARQARFLQYRGFTTDQIQQVLSARDSD